MPRRVRRSPTRIASPSSSTSTSCARRLIVCLVVFGVALALCFWQNHLLLEIASGPAPQRPQEAAHLRRHRAVHDDADRRRLRRRSILSLPFLLYQLYAYVLPAFSDAERRVVLPILLLVADSLPRRRRLRLLRRDAGRRQVPARLQRQPVQRPGPRPRLLQLLLDDDARPAASSSSCRWRSSPSPGSASSSVEQLSSNRRYAYLIIAIVAAALPGVDPISMLIEMVPLLVLFELSILLARAFGTAERRREAWQSPQPRSSRRRVAGAASDGWSSTSGDGASTSSGSSTRSSRC